MTEPRSDPLLIEPLDALADAAVAEVNVLDERLKGIAANGGRIADTLDGLRVIVALPDGMVLKGDKGNIGEVGPEGPLGPQGLVGPKGPKGDDGLDGIDGVTGAKGDSGPIGETGPRGSKGDRGETGLTGDTGPVGPRGPRGSGGGSGGGGGVALSNAVPLVESGSGSAGSGIRASKDDHVHPADSGGPGSDDQTAAEVPLDPEVFDQDNVQSALELTEAVFAGINGQLADHIAAGSSTTITSAFAPTESDLAPAGAMWVHIDEALVYINYGTDTEPIWAPPQRDGIGQILTNGNVALGQDILGLGRLISDTGQWEANRLSLGVEGVSIEPPPFFSFESVATPFTSTRLIRLATRDIDGASLIPAAAVWAGTDDPSAVVPASAEFTLEPDAVPLADEWVTLNVQTPTGGYRTTEHILLDPWASTSDIQTFIENLSNVGPGNVIVTGGPWPAVVTIAFTGDLADTQVALGIEDSPIQWLFAETVTGAAPIVSGVGGLYMRDNAGTAETWRKEGAGDTDWTLFGSGGTPAADPGDIADPTIATAETVALKLNALMAAMRTAGSLA